MVHGHHLIEEEQEMIPLSAFNHFMYCPRRCYLIHVEGEFTDNVHTLLGTFEHERVDQIGHKVNTDVHVEYALPVWNRRLGLSGKCDAVEFHSEGVIYPVEHKHGERRRWINDDFQLAAQAMCLEEMLGRPVEKGAIYHYQSRRRRELIIDLSLRNIIEDTAVQIRQLLKEKLRPQPIKDKRRCSGCSLHEICQPEMIHSSHKLLQMNQCLFDDSEEVYL